MLRANQWAMLPEIGADDAVVGQARRQLRDHALGIDRGGAAHRALLDHFPPVTDARLEPLAPRAVLLAPEQRRERAQRLGAVALQMDFHRVADAEHLAVDVDLHAARLALLGEEFRVREVRAHHEQRVAAHHQLVARARAEQADRTGDERQVVRQHGAAEQRLGDPGPENLGDLDHLVGGVERTLADQDGHALAGIEHRGGAAQVGFLRHHLRRGIADAGVDAAVHPRRRRHRVHLLHVVRHDHAGHGALGQGDAHGAVDQMAHLRRRRAHLHVLAGHVLEQAEQIDFLLVVATERRPLLLADDRDHRRVVEPGVVQAVQEMDRARAGGRHAHARLAGELGMGAGHERGDFFAGHLDELEAILGAARASSLGRCLPRQRRPAEPSSARRAPGHPWTGRGNAGTLPGGRVWPRTFRLTRGVTSGEQEAAPCRRGRVGRRRTGRRVSRRGTDHRHDHDAVRTGRLRRVYALFPQLAERRRHLGTHLSGGEQQMVAIGRALMTHPELVILDEATEGLAPLCGPRSGVALPA